MKLENLNKITRLSNELSRLNGMIKQAIPNSEMRVDVSMTPPNVPSLYLCVDNCSPGTSRAVADLLIAELQGQRDAVAEELRGLGVEI